MKKILFSITVATFLLGAGFAHAENFTDVGTVSWTVPSDALKIRVETWGGGGAGGSGTKTKNHNISGFGGGAGGYAMKEFFVTPGDRYQVTVGTGGKNPGRGGSNSEFVKDGQVLVGAGGGGGGMSGVGNYAGGGTSGQNGVGPGAGTGGTNVSYAQKSMQVSTYDEYAKNGTYLFYNNSTENPFALFEDFVAKLFLPVTVFAQTDPATVSTPPEPDFDPNYVGVAGQGGRGYAGSTQLKGADGGGYTKVGDNPYASSGGSAQQGGIGGLRGRLGRDGTGCCTSGDTWALDGSIPGGGGGGSDTGTGASGANGKVSITVLETPLPTVSLSASATQIAKGGSVTLSWTAENASGCNAFGGWTGEKNLTSTGEVVQNIQTGTTFVLICSNAAGESASDSVAVNIIGGPQLEISPATATVKVGETVTLTSTASGVGLTNHAFQSIAGTWTGEKSWSSNLTNPDIRSTQISFSTPGQYSVYSNASNLSGTSYSDQSLITVEAADATMYPPEGSLENVSCSAISGWAYDQNIPNNLVQVRIYDGLADAGGILLGTVWTDQYRPDINLDKNISGNHGFSYAVPASLRDNRTRMIYVYGVDSALGTNTLLGGAPRSFNCSPVVEVPPSPIVGITASPASLDVPGTVTLSWMSIGADSCVTSWMPGIRPRLGSETSPKISQTTTFTVSCMGVGGGSGSDSVTVPLSSVANIVTDPNALINNPTGLGNNAVWNSINTPASAQTGQTITFSASIKNTGTKTWGTNYRIAMKDSNHQSIVEVPPPYSVTPNQSVTVSFSTAMPSSAGSKTYYFQALEPNVEWFGQEASRSITVTAPATVVPPAAGGSCVASWNNMDLPAGYKCYSALGDQSNLGVMPPVGSKQVPSSPSSYTLVCNDSPVTNVQMRTVTAVCPPVTIDNGSGGGGGGGGGTGGGSCRNTDGPLSAAISNNKATLSWNTTNYGGIRCIASGWESRWAIYSDPLDNRMVVGESWPITITGPGGWGIYCWAPGSKATNPDATPRAQFNVSSTCPVANVPDFTASASSPVKMQVISGVGGTSRPTTISIGPANGFSSPVTITAVPPSQFGGMKVEYSWNGGSFSSDVSNTIQPSVNGYPPVTLAVRVSGGSITEGSYVMGMRALGGTLPLKSFSFTMTVNKGDIQYREQ